MAVTRHVGTPSQNVKRKYPLSVRAMLVRLMISSGLSAGVFALPVIMSISGLASVSKLAFLGCALLRAAMLVRDRPASYVCFVVWLLALSPGLRHYVDLFAGYSQSNPMMLAPYGAMLLSLPACARYLVEGRRYAGSCAIMVLIVTAGAWAALLTGAFQDPLLTAIRWICPILLAIYVCANAVALPEIRDKVALAMRIALPALSVYAIIQFVAILPWDAYFMEMAPINSIGFPRPFEVRVFSTMNSPGSFAALLAFGIMILLPQIRGWEFVSILLAFGALFLTTQRAAMGALALAVVVLALTSRNRQLQAGIAKLVLICGIALAATVAMPEASERITGSFTSVTNLGNDGSARERAEQYEQLGSKLEERPYGWGLAWSTNQFLLKGSPFALDSAIIDILVSFGVVGGIIFLGTLATLAAQAWFAASGTRDARAKAEFGAVLYGLLQLPFGGQHAGEHGMFLYLALGLLLARACPVPGAAVVPPRDPAAADGPQGRAPRPRRLGLQRAE